MNLTNEIIADIVSYVNLADIKEFVLTHPEVVQEEEFLETLIFGSWIIKTKITKSNNFDFVIWKGAKQND